MLLEVAGLKKSFGSIIVADELDLAIATGEAVGIIGPNGAGKTTLFNLIAGGLSPNAGTIRVDGRDLAINSPAWRNGVALFSNSPASSPLSRIHWVYSFQAA